MFIKNPEFRISAVSPKQYPDDGLPQVVLVGKSNVGKSSFINTLVNRKKLARTSSEPGKTRQINFYNMDEKFYLVDLPGYGFSKMSKQEQAKVGTFIEEYLQKSKNIALIVFLIDIRHDPTANDKLMYDYIFKTNLPCIVIANKADLVNQKPENALCISALTGEGVAELKNLLRQKVCDIEPESLEFVTNARQQECLKKARASIEQALLAAQLNELQDLISIDVKSAVLALDELTGELITDNILDNIFEHFCIGK